MFEASDYSLAALTSVGNRFVFTFLAWSGVSDRVEDADLLRVKHVLSLGDYTFHRRFGPGDGALGVATWEPPNTREVNVEAWNASRRGVTVLPHLPIGASAVTGKSRAGSMVKRLASACRDRPSSVVPHMAPPFCLIDVDNRSQCLTIVNDGIGMARLYQRRVKDLWLWSNRPAVLYAATGDAVEIDVEGWSRFAGSGWFLSMSSPYLGTTRVPPSTAISVGVKRRPIFSDTGALSLWTTPPRGSGTVSVEAAADGLRSYVEELHRFAPGQYRVDLSGGRDSRAVAAAAIAAQIDMKLRTFGPIQEEITTAQRLVELAGTDVEHVVSIPTPIDHDHDSLHTRIMALHDLFDGDFTPIKMNRPTHEFRHPEISLGGAGGEIAHGNYYASSELLERIKKKGPRGSMWRLDRYFRQMPGPTKRSHDLAVATLEAWYERAQTLGIVGPVFLDFFYLVERFRRWAPAAHQPHSYSPFAAPEFIRATFDMRPRERVQSRLHSGVITALIPEWKDVPFFKAQPGGRDYRTEHKLRLWQGDTAQEVDQLLESTEAWEDVFDVEAVSDLWAKAKREGLVNRLEATFQRVLWRRVFEDHIDDLNKRIAAH